MKHLLLPFLFLLLFPLLGSSQQMPDTAEYPYWIDMMQDPQANFFETQIAFEKYWENRQRDKGDGWKPFKRWEYYMSQRVDEYGNKPKPGHKLREYEKLVAKGNKTGVYSAEHWLAVGPINRPLTGGITQPPGMGRINGIGFHPTNSNIIYVGAPAGGLWKTIDGGQNWEVLTDTLPTLGVSSIVVDYSNPSIVYIGTGDRDAGDALGLGVFKSTDAGQTWSVSSTGLGNRVVGSLIMNPLDSMTLLAATNGGIYKSTDGGQSWARKSSNTINYKQILFKPADTSVVYATASGDFYRSADGGESWTRITSGLPGSNRLVIGVSPANSSYVYLCLTNQRTFKGLYRSTNSGLSFTVRSTTPNIMDYSTNGSGSSGQAWYDLCIAVDPANIGNVYVGGVNIFKSTDGGATWSINAHWTGSGGAPKVHADQHTLEVSPVNNRIYVGNDGGVYYTTNGGSSWVDISDGLVISQVYKIGQSAQSKSLIINGYQDNGTSIYDGTWRREIGGDGMECIIDPSDSSYMYGSLYYGAIRRSSNYGLYFSNIASSITETGEWVTPFVLRESDPGTMYTGFKNVWRSTNVKTSGVSWTQISNTLGGSNSQGIRVLENSPADDDILYISREDNKFFRSDDINATTPSYTDLTSSLPTGTWPRDIEAHPFDVDKVYIVQSKKVYSSSNQGSTWTNLDPTTSLPNVDINCIVYDSSSIGDLYIGTDLGVFFKGSWMSEWIPFNGGMPTAPTVTELEIYYDQNRSNSRIKAATYGRGTWSSPLFTKPTADFYADEEQVCVNQSVQFTDISEGLYHSLKWEFPGANPSASSNSSPSVTYSNPGNYNVKLVIWNDFLGDSIVKTAYISVDTTPMLSISPSSANINKGDSVELKASGAITYTWSPITGLDKFRGPVVKASPNATTTYTVTGDTNCNSVSGQAQATVVVLQTGLNEVNFDKGKVVVFPNPVKSLLTLSFSDVSEGEKNVLIVDASGRSVYEDKYVMNVSNDRFEIDLSNEPNGLYLLQLQGEDGMIIFKFLVDHSK